MYIGLISDTHGVFSDEFKKFLEPVDEIWHAGDFGGDEIFYWSIANFKPLKGVYGNCDGMDIRRLCPKFQNFDIEGMNVLMTHIGGSPGHYESRSKELIEMIKPDIFICGHSHILKVMHDQKNDLMYINPGAAGIQGWHIVRTALRFKIEAGEIKEMEVFELPRSVR